MWYQEPAAAIRQALDNHRADDEWLIKKEEARVRNGWFTPESVDMAFDAWLQALEAPAVSSWLGQYEFPGQPGGRELGIIMAGNLPLVGLHDLLCGLTAGWRVRIKTSSDDEELMKTLVTRLLRLKPEWEEHIRFSDHFKGLDAAIATGSNNSGRYFEYYFRQIPHLLRGHRNGVAVLMGDETEEELEALGHDIFDHFGLGCRNVTHLMIPEGFELVRLFHAWEPYSGIIHHHKYANNYHYHRALLLMNLDQHLDNGFVVLKQTEDIYAPVGMVGYSVYQSPAEVTEKLSRKATKIQVIIGKGQGMQPFGTAQHPGLGDYADGVDTLAWLLKI